MSKEKKKKKKVGHGWKKLVSTALGTAADLAPVVLPLMMGGGGHAGLKSAVAANPGAFSGVPLASSNTGDISQLTGLRDYRVMAKDSWGNVRKVKVVTCDLIEPVPNAAGYAAGDIAYEAWVSPLDPAFQGTKFAEFGAQFERWRLKKGAFIYASTCAATNNGAFTMAVFNDPQVDVNSFGGLELLRVAGSQAQSETFVVYNHGCAGVPVVGDSKDMLYTDPDGTDVRFTVAGKLVLVASAAIASGFAPGLLYFLAETEYEVPSLVEGSNAGASCIITDNTAQGAYTDNYSPIQVYNVNRQYLGEGAEFKISATYTAAGTPVTGNALVGLSSGDWWIVMKTTGTGLSGTIPFATDELMSYGSTDLSSVGEFGSTTEMTGFYAVSIPQGLPDGLVQVGFFNVQTTATLTSITVVKINEGLYTADGVSALATRRKKTDLFYASTMQGRQRLENRRVTQLSIALKALSTTALAQASPALSSNVLFGPTPPRNPTTPTTKRG